MASIEPFSLPGKFLRGNLHTHSTLSDGRLTPEQVIERYKASGYDFLVLSDHFVQMYDWPVADTREFRSNTFTTISGAELHAPKTNAGELWHILAAGLPLDFAPAGKKETGSELAQRAVDAGAFVAITHPEWSQLDLNDGLSIDCAHAVEIYNHGCAVECARGGGWYLLDQLCNLGHRLTAIATDDAHFTYGDQDAFGGWINVKTQSLNPEVILSALKEGHFYSSQGPQFHNVELADTTLKVNCSPVDSIIVVNGTSRTTGGYGKAITSAELNLKDLEKGWLLEKLSPWFRVVITDGQGKSAWTNPYWLDD